MSFDLPKNLLEQIEPDEKIIDSLKTTTVTSKPDYVVLTNTRIIYFNEKHLGRYEFTVIPFSKLQTMRAERGLVYFGEITFINESGEKISLNWIPKNEIEPFIESLEDAMNRVAVEPITIKRVKNIGSKMQWQFDKPPELIFRSQSDLSTHGTEADPLNELKMRYARGEITEEEYNKMKKFLESNNS